MIRVRGDAELVAGLAAIGDGLDHLDDAQRAAAEIVLADARGRAPKRTGTLARSGQVTRGVVGFGVRYGIPVHFGVPSRNQRPQPFLANAVKAQTTAVVGAYTKSVQALIDRSV